MGRAVDRPESKRKHRATGQKAPGGARPGSGRKPGSTPSLPYGEVKAIQVTRLRLPETATEDEARMAGRSLQRIVDVMEGRVSHYQAGHVLKAATRVREEICGPIEQKMKHSGSVTISVVDPYAKREPASMAPALVAAEGAPSTSGLEEDLTPPSSRPVPVETHGDGEE